MRISDWSSDVCSSDLEEDTLILGKVRKDFQNVLDQEEALHLPLGVQPQDLLRVRLDHHLVQATVKRGIDADPVPVPIRRVHPEPIGALRSEEHTSALQSLMRISYAVFCLQKKNTQTHK